ncbi:MAG TPA: very short patch repair endonuclease, partial [Verrucomicrobiota bacterium]|nr:very short patch repair endonuclease [Verrucomicrobiota bacterium]
MPDVFTKAQRSQLMARIRSRGNARTEGALARRLRAHGITGWRRHVPRALEAPGSRAKAPSRSAGRKGGGRGAMRRTSRVRPDFVFRAARLAVFVDGCFWHGCPRHGTRPKGNAAFWRRKFAANIARDRRVDRALRRAGWRVLRIWEHALRSRQE